MTNCCSPQVTQCSILARAMLPTTPARRCGSSNLGRALISNSQPSDGTGDCRVPKLAQTVVKAGIRNPAVCEIGSYGLFEQ